MEQIITQMKKLGLTEYEVKAYLTLLKEHPINGYALSKSSGIPRSRIYEVLDGLAKKQVVFEHSGEKSSTWSPLEPGLLIKKLQTDFEQVLQEVDDYTTKVYAATDEDLEPKTLVGRKEVLELVKILIGQAKKRIALSIWDEELGVISSDLDKVVAGGVALRGVYFGYKNPYNELVAHRRIDRYIAEKAERFLIVIIDDEHVLSGVISRDNVKVTWSRDPEMIEINDDFIAHDVMINRYSESLVGHAKVAFEHSLDSIREDYYVLSDEESKVLPKP